ncbi:MAG: penicillin acylase family protein [Microthrixaceae bacterium]
MHTGRWRHSRRWIGGALGVLALLAGCTDDSDWSGAPAVSDVPDGADVAGAGDRYAATIRRTEGGVAHITGDSLADVSFGQGWASGEDRACDLADQVLRVHGERARWFGPGEDEANIDSDVSWRAIGIRRIAEEDWERASEQVRELIGAYATGWNAQLAEVGVDGISDWCAGADWVRPLEPIEVYTYARSIALLASSAAVADMVGVATPPTGPGDGAANPEEETAEGAHVEPVTASNGWAIGSERSAGGGGMLVANPHVPWEGELRFWEVHLTVPGELDMYGVQLSGLPGVAIGFGEEFGWTHTVSDGARFTAYTLDLVPGSPTTYRYGDGTRELQPEEIVVEVRGEDGQVAPTSRTVWSSHYGPVLDFPGVGWTEERTITLRDANLGNDEFIEQYVDMLQVEDLDGLIALNERVTGVPLFNTVAVSADGRAWYGDTAATPALSQEAIAAYETALGTEPLVGLAADNGAVLLDGSDPLYEWQDLPGARDPGLVPYADMPVVERADYVFNANDSFWMPHATEMLEGDYSPLHGEQRTPRSPRTRENATVLDDTSGQGASGADGEFDLDELAAAAIANRGYTSRALRDEVVERCRDAEPVEVDAVLDDEGVEQLPAGTVDVGPACEVLAGWDGVYDTDRRGAVVWRELVSGFDRDELLDTGPLWAAAFDPAEPVATPSGLAAPGPDGDQVLVRLARAVQVIEKSGHGVDVPLGELQVAERNGTLVPIHGGNAADGTTNVVGWGTGWNTLDPSLTALEREPLAPGSPLSTVSGAGPTTVGYRINSGTSFLMALEFTEEGPRARTFLTYGNTADRSDPAYLEATERFSTRRWKDVAFTPDAVDEAATSTLEVRG